jgi:hypothetical protein
MRYVYLLTAAKLWCIDSDEQSLYSTLLSVLYDPFCDIPVFVDISVKHVSIKRPSFSAWELTAGKTALGLLQRRPQSRRMSRKLG